MYIKLVFIWYLQVEDRISKGKDHANLEKLKDLLNEKNTYMHYYKNEDVKTQERFCEHNTTKVMLSIK